MSLDLKHLDALTDLCAGNTYASSAEQAAVQHVLEEHQRALTLIRDLQTLGATGEAPISRIPGDMGGLKAALSIVDDGISKKLFLDFGTKIAWLSMTKAEAMAFSSALRERAEKLP